MKFKPVVVLSYALVLIGYMTLTISLPIVTIIIKNTGVYSVYLYNAISILFISFSISAIYLSCVADSKGPYKVLKYSQICSISGLFFVALSSDIIIFYIGFILIGLGTGCYSSIGRMLLSIQYTNIVSLKKAFSYFSALVVLGPMFSGYMAVMLVTYSWRIVFIGMAVIEVLLLICVRLVIGCYKYQGLVEVFNSRTIVAGYIYCLKSKYYFINVIFVGISVATFVKILNGNMHDILIIGFDTSRTFYTNIMLGLTFGYIAGVVVLRFFPKNLDLYKARIWLCLLFLISSIIFWFIESPLAIGLISIIFCFILGQLSPLSASSSLVEIKKYKGSASAFITFTFALISAVFSLIQGFVPISTLLFNQLLLHIISILAVVLAFYAYRYKKKNQKS